MKRIYFLILAFFFTSTVFCQEIWPRTYSGYKDAATDGVEDPQRNLYVIGSNGSAEHHVNLIYQSAKNTDLTNIKINVSSWKIGNYFLRLTTESGKVLKKNFIVK